MRCPSCSHDNREGRNFCVQCGTELIVSCPSCDARNEPGERFCGQCGKPVAEASGDQTLVAQPPVTSSQRGLPDSFGDGRYQVQRFLGEGGVKRVYLARDTKLDSDVAIALVKIEGLDADDLTRIRREAQAMGRLRDHPHIVTVLDIGDEGEQPYIVQEHMEGGPLSALSAGL